MESSECCSNICSEKTNSCVHPTPNVLARPATTGSTPCYGIGHKVTFQFDRLLDDFKYSNTKPIATSITQNVMKKWKI